MCDGDDDGNDDHIWKWVFDNTFLGQYIIKNAEPILVPVQVHHHRRRKYKCVVSLGVGKSCILMQFLENKFKIDSETTVGV